MLIFNCQPIRFEYKRPKVDETRTLSSGLARVGALFADQKESRLSGRDWLSVKPQTNRYSFIDIIVLGLISRT